jgi:hypothetical protein
VLVYLPPARVDRAQEERWFFTTQTHAQGQGWALDGDTWLVAFPVSGPSEARTASDSLRQVVHKRFGDDVRVEWMMVTGWAEPTAGQLGGYAPWPDLIAATLAVIRR